MRIEPPTVTVIGLGYVGLPLAIALARHGPTAGLDVSLERLGELRAGMDRTGEIDAEVLRASTLQLVGCASECPPSDIYIITVPTPIDADNRPDLTMVERAGATVGALLRESAAQGLDPIVVLESTVYPGVTEHILGPVLETASGLRCGVDFHLGYSPERINPGDRKHTIETITKVVSGQSEAVLDRVAAVYERITSGGVFRAASIMTAEAAKVIENAQRDINIAFMNEVTQVFARMNISTWDVLAAAQTKWNFLPFSPGLVGGHCIGVDPYYLAHRAVELGHNPQVILAGRAVNDSMASWLAARLHEKRNRRPGSVLVLGLTFKENVPDLRNSKVADLISSLGELGHDVTVHDPLADGAEAMHEYGITIDPDALDRLYDLVVLAVPHQAYLALGIDKLRAVTGENGTLADIKGVLGGNADWTL